MNKRQYIHAVLKAAKPFLSKTYRCGDKEQFICHALLRVKRSRRELFAAAILAEKMIMERLNGQYTAENWLARKIGWYEIDKAPVDAVQQWRHRWLDSMIKEFSK